MPLMNLREPIQTELIKLTGNERVLRLSDCLSGLTLEKKLDPQRSVALQKQQLHSVFMAVLAQAATTAS